MKTICVVLCFLLINSSKLVIGHENDDEALLKCKVEVGATDGDVKMIADKKLPITHSGFCLLACLYEHAGIIREGKLVVENLNKIVGATIGRGAGSGLAKQFIEEVTSDCENVQNNDKCMLSKDIILCEAESISRHTRLKHEL